MTAPLHLRDVDDFYTGSTIVVLGVVVTRHENGLTLTGSEHLSVQVGNQIAYDGVLAPYLIPGKLDLEAFEDFLCEFRESDRYHFQFPVPLSPSGTCRVIVQDGERRVHPRRAWLITSDLQTTTERKVWPHGAETFRGELTERDSLGNRQIIATVEAPTESGAVALLGQVNYRERR